MFIKIRDQFRKFAPYIDKPNSFNENIGETLGIIILILFVGAFLYLVIDGFPSILKTLNFFLQAVEKLFTGNM